MNFVGLGMVVVLGAWLLARRYTLVASKWRAGWSTRATVFAHAVVLAASAPLLLRVTDLTGPNAILMGDAPTHAAIAHAIAMRGLPHGWVDVLNGGFPVAIHYPAVGWLLTSALMRLGVLPVVAMHIVGISTLLATPACTLAAARAHGARPVAGVAAALFVAWLAPYSGFFGGWDAYVARGLLSQAVAWPLVPLLVAGLAPRARPWAPLLMALLTAAHPQIAIGTLVVLWPVFALCRLPKGRLLRVTIAAGVAGVAIFGPGARSLKVPFGWPPLEEWQRIGYPPARLLHWLFDGAVFDLDRPPVLSCWAALALVLLCAFLNRRACRIALLCAAVLLGLVLTGGRLATLGPLGEALLGFVQPLRLVALLPFAGACMVCVAIEELTTTSFAVLSRWRPVGVSDKAYAMLVSALVLAGLAVGGLFAIPARVAWLSKRIAIGDRSLGDCGRHRPGADESKVLAWLPSLTRGRVEFYDRAPMSHCAIPRGVALESPIPLARSGGAGAHVGVLDVAFAALRAEMPGSVQRAEALGVRAVVHPAAMALPPGWRRVHEGGEEALSVREAGTDMFGPVCIEDELQGTDAALRAALLADLQGDARTLRQRTLLVPGSQQKAQWVPSTAPICQTDGVSIHESIREMGAYQADIATPREMQIVLRASSFPTWRIDLDGVSVPFRVLAPGFPLIQVPAGEHRITAVAGLPSGYVPGLCLAAMACFALSRRQLPFARARRRYRRRWAQMRGGA
jgi:hypothetical protein